MINRRLGYRIYINAKPIPPTNAIGKPNSGLGNIECKNINIKAFVTTIKNLLLNSLPNAGMRYAL
jgi:hypothetical protein